MRLNLHRIKYYTSGPYSFSYANGVPVEVREKLKEACKVVDSVFPGTLTVLRRLGINFVFDPRNRFIPKVNGDIVAEKNATNSFYFPPLNTISFSKRGLRWSIPHELVHALDIHSGYARAAFSISAFCHRDGTPKTEVYAHVAGGGDIDMTSPDMMLTHMLENIPGEIDENQPSLPYTLFHYCGFDLDPAKPFPHPAERSVANYMAKEMLALYFESVLHHRTRKVKVKLFPPDNWYKAAWTPEYLDRNADKADLLWERILSNINSLSDDELLMRRPVF